MKAYVVKRADNGRMIGRERKEITLYPTADRAKFWLMSDASGLRGAEWRYRVEPITLVTKTCVDCEHIDAGEATADSAGVCTKKGNSFNGKFVPRWLANCPDFRS